MNKEERRKQDIAWLKYIGKRVKSHWLTYVEIGACVALLEYLGLHEISKLIGFTVFAFLLGAEVMLAMLRDYCLKHKINPDTLERDV